MSDADAASDLDIFDDRPLILTAMFDPASQRMVQDQRDRHFPASLNIVPAHLTLFHHLPGPELARVDATLRTLCGELAPIPFGWSGLRSLGRGVAIDIDCPPLAGVRRRLAEHWRSWLKPQDRQGFRPHVTVQNKVSPAAARMLLAELSATLEPRSGTVVGLALWRYQGGPWGAVRRYPFDAADAAKTGGRPTRPPPGADAEGR